MINVSVSSVFELAKALGGNKTDIELAGGADITALLDCLSEKSGGEAGALLYSENGAFKDEEFSIMINGRNVFAYNGLKQALNDGDDVLILPIVGGG